MRLRSQIERYDAMMQKQRAQMLEEMQQQQLKMTEKHREELQRLQATIVDLKGQESERIRKIKEVHNNVK